MLALKLNVFMNYIIKKPNNYFILPVDVRVFSFSIIVSLDYLMKVKDFFGADDTSKQPIQASQKVPETVVKKRTEQAPGDTKLTINLHIEKPDIILLEDMDDIDSNCIILNVCTFFPFIAIFKSIVLIF